MTQPEPPRAPDQPAPDQPAPDQPGPGGLDLSRPASAGASDEAADASRRSLLVAAALIFRAETRELLIARRREGDYLGGLWEFPGGKVEAFEDPRESLRREIAEELGVRVEVGRVAETLYCEDERFAVVILCYVCRLPGGERPCSLEVAEWRWTPLAELDQFEFVPGDVPYARLLAESARAGERPLG